jgi:1-acyl-sn-glycerol-3-phosphate acyltransferase
MSAGTTFRAAKPWGWVIRVVRTYLRLVLFWRNRLHLEQRDLEVLRGLPPGSGVILAPNHADETDFKVCLVLSRRCQRRFLFMMNREAFDEGFGTAGWWLQRLGAFSVERGGQNEGAKRYAIDLVIRGQDVLVIFPEGEIFYLNDLVQPFKSGAVDIGMQAVVESQRTRADWTAHLIPLAIKYRYRKPIRHILERRIRRMERYLLLRKSGLSFQKRMERILAALLHRQELGYDLKPASDRLIDLGERVKEVREAILSRIEGKYAGPAVSPQSQPMDRAWRLSSHLKSLVTQMGRLGRTIPEQTRSDLAALKRIVQMGTWQPQYVELDPSQERLAETVLKLEREVYQTQRPRQLANRGVFLRIGEPIDLRCFVSAYLKDARSVRHRVAQELRDRIQGLIDAMAAVTAASSGVRSDGSAVGSFGRRETCPVDEPPGDQPKPPEANHSGRSEASVRD